MIKPVLKKGPKDYPNLYIKDKLGQPGGQIELGISRNFKKFQGAPKALNFLGIS